MSKQCNKCGQKNADWATECGRCEEALSDSPSIRLLDDLKARRGCGMAYDQLLTERKISDLLEKASNDTDDSRKTRKD